MLFLGKKLRVAETRSDPLAGRILTMLTAKVFLFYLRKFPDSAAGKRQQKSAAYFLNRYSLTDRSLQLFQKEKIPHKKQMRASGRTVAKSVPTEQIG
jgi:hypothetical protein